MRWNRSTCCGPPSIDAWKGIVMLLLGLSLAHEIGNFFPEILYNANHFFIMNISKGIDNFFRITNYARWSVIDCLESLAKNCTAVTTENQRSFQFKEIIAFYDRMDKKVSEIVQASSGAQTNDEEDQEVDDAIIDKIIVDKVSTLLFSNLNLEEVWIKVMERLKKDNLRVQSIESRIVDLSADWTKIEWCLRREVNVLILKHRERDFIVKVLSPIIGTLLEEIDIGIFELNWYDQERVSQCYEPKMKGGARRIYGPYYQYEKNGFDKLHCEVIKMSYYHLKWETQRFFQLN
uniref:Uncharacterized protein n=1 Tax=Rhizophagus irregularis (strain DAOM 181602 / DAOM 197198 / MUCL 43194) TaxID=747089 RepID=U9U7V2_RHIID